MKVDGVGEEHRGAFHDTIVTSGTVDDEVKCVAVSTITEGESNSVVMSQLMDWPCS